jgi:hypothetical protein
VILRSVADGVATLDVAEALAADGAVPAALHRPAGGATWTALTATATATVQGFRRYRVDVPAGAGELAPYARVAGGGRLFDHNRNSSDFVNYTLPTVAEDAAACPVVKPHALVEFKAGYTQEQHGPIVAGGRLHLQYALARLPQCRYSRAGAQLWDVEAFVKWQPSGALERVSVTRVASGTREPIDVELSIPLGTQYVDVWFRNYNGDQSCETWDSNLGNNYRFGGTTLPAPVGWAGDWGNGLWRGCTHRDGLDEPVRIDGYILERACKFIEADVYVPGVTDGWDPHPEKLWAQVELSKDGAPATHAFLAYQGRVGNNYRYRWELPYEIRFTDWTRYLFAFRFSSDGARWFRIAQGAGPDGGAPRTVERAFLP